MHKVLEFMIESLESRRHLTTTTFMPSFMSGTSFTYDGITATLTHGPDASANYGPYWGFSFRGAGGSSDTYTVTYTGLPAHSMVRIGVSDEGEFSDYNGDYPAFNLTAGGSEQHWGYNAAGSTTSLNFGKWFASNAGTLEVTFEADNMSGYAWYSIMETWIDLYKPSVSGSGGGGNMTESGNSNGNGFGSGSASFTISRDLPSGWVGTPFGDSPIPDTTVAVSIGGSAEKEDYTKAPNSEALPENSVVLNASTDHKTYTIIPIDDSETEVYPISPTLQDTVIYNVTTAPGVVVTLSAAVLDDSYERAAVLTQAIPDTSEVPVDTSTSVERLVAIDADGQPIRERTVTALMYTKSYQAVGLQNTSSYGGAAWYSGTLSYGKTATNQFQFGVKVKDVTLSYTRTQGTTTAITATATDSYGFAHPGIKWRSVAYVEHRDYFNRTIIERQTGENGGWTPAGPGSDTAHNEGSGDMLGEFKSEHFQWHWVDAEINL